MQDTENTVVAGHPPRLLLAPMEGLVDALMRDILTRASPYDWCVTEFARVTSTLLPPRFFTRIAPELLTASQTAAGTAVHVQILGSDPACMADNALRLAALRPAAIDLNFGCPAPTVNLHRGGAILLDEPNVLYDIVRAVSAAVGSDVVVSAKMRLGVNDTSRALEAAQALVEGGAQRLVVHARTKVDGYKPPAHWAWIARIAESVKVPVVANGEIWSVEDYWRCRSESGMRDVMLGRGAVANPLLVARIRHSIASGERGNPDAHSLAQDWQSLRPLITEFWLRVQDKLEARHVPGRLKQWLNLLRRSYPEAQALYTAVRPLRDVASITPWVLSA